jgi:hypothetical protein
VHRLPPSIVAASSLVAVQLADMNGDAVDDAVLLLANGTVVVAPNNGSDVFEEGWPVISDMMPVGDASTLAVVDANTDGQLDVVVGSSGEATGIVLYRARPPSSGGMFERDMQISGVLAGVGNITNLVPFVVTCGLEGPLALAVATPAAVHVLLLHPAGAVPAVSYNASGSSGSGHARPITHLAAGERHR